MQTLDHDSVSLHMAAPADDIYAIVADVTRTPEYSPEILKCEWLDGATESAVGARFVATNKVPNRPSWRNKPVVTVVEPGRTFAFARTEPFGGTVEWTYEFEPDGGGTTVTESYEVTKNVQPDRLVRHRRAVRPQGPPHRPARRHDAVVRASAGDRRAVGKHLAGRTSVERGSTASTIAPAAPVPRSSASNGTG